MHTMLIPTEPMLREAAITSILETGKPAQKLSTSTVASVSLRDTTFVGSSSAFDFDFDTDNDDDESSSNDDCIVEKTKGPLAEASCPSSHIKSRPSSILKTNSGSSCATASTTSESNSCTKRVDFDVVRIRSYEQTMGDNPSVRYGPPIQLDWEYEQHDGIGIDVYESDRIFSRRHTLNQMAMSYYQRKAVLSRNYGFTDEDFKKAKKSCNNTKFKRAVTTTLLPMMPVEDVIQRLGKKAKRIIDKVAQYDSQFYP